MKTRIFLGMGLLMSAIGFGQTTAYYPANHLDLLNNVIIGLDTGNIANTTGTDNVFAGYRAGRFNLTGSHNVFLGLESGHLNASGENNIFIGQAAGRDNITGIQNISIGVFAGRENEMGNHNVNIGSNAGRDNMNSGNVFFGAFSGQQNTGTGNVFNGMYTGQISGAGSNNTYVGYLAGHNSTGSNNTFLGRNAGSGEVTTATGSGNVLIGNSAGSKLTSENNQLYINNSDRSNPLIYGNFATSVRELKFNAKKVGIGFEIDPATSNNEGFGIFPVGSTIPNIADYRLFVKGGILAEEVRIRLQGDWADYVFAKDYKLLSLKDTEKYIAENGHLPNMPSAEKVKAEGVELGNIVTLQQEKIEELTLHLIEQQKQIEELKAQVQLLLNKR